MTIRRRLAPTALALFLAPLVGCFGVTEDTTVTGGNSPAAGSGVAPSPVSTTTQQLSEDKGDRLQGGFSDANGTGRPDSTNATVTGGLGGKRTDGIPGPAESGTDSKSAPK